MKYLVNINKRVRNVRIYSIVKKVNENTNAVSKMFQKIIDKYILKKKSEDELA